MLRTDDIMGRHTDQQFMEQRREQEDNGTRELVIPTSSNERRVDMASHEMIDRLVPRPPILEETMSVKGQERGDIGNGVLTVPTLALFHQSV